MSGIGCKGFDPSEKTLEILKTWKKQPENDALVPESLGDIEKDLGDCKRCRLCKTRKHIVFGEGNHKAGIVFVGEGPGAKEDLQARPFVGKAGLLLTKIINAMQMEREDVYICNIVKCRPPGNRNPEPDEISTCIPFLKRQILSLKPDVICTLGKVATQSLLGIEAPISKLRGTFHAFNEIPVMPTYHPAYLLRNPKMKRAVWEDMQQIMKRIKA